MTNTFDYIAIRAMFDGQGVIQQARIDESVSSFLKYSEDVDYMKDVFKKFVNYAFRKSVNMNIELEANGADDYSPFCRLYCIDIMANNRDTGTVTIYKCDKYGNTSSDRKTIYGRKAACTFIADIIETLKFAYDNKLDSMEAIA